MRYLQLLVLLTALTSQTVFARCRHTARPSPVMAALQKILTTGNNQPMQTRNRRLPLEPGMPVNLPLPYMRNVQQKCPCQLEQPCPRVLPEMRVPEILKIQEIRRPEMRIQKPIPMITEMPKPYVSNMPTGSVMTAPFMYEMPLEIRRFPEVNNIPIIQERYECSCASPKALVNPFLPAASSVSPYALPTSNLLPPVTPNTGKNNFLRKIPIPPPTL